MGLYIPGGRARGDSSPSSPPGTQVVANPAGTDGEDLLRVRIGETDWNIPGSREETGGRRRTQLRQVTSHSIPDSGPSATGAHVTFSWDADTGDEATEYDELLVHVDEGGAREFLFAYTDPPGLSGSTSHYMLTSAPDLYVDPDITFRSSHPREIVVRLQREDTLTNPITNATVTLYGIKYVGAPGRAGTRGTLWTVGDAFPASPGPGDMHIFPRAVASGLSWVDSGGSALDAAVAGDYARYDADNSRWQQVGSLLGPEIPGGVQRILVPNSDGTWPAASAANLTKLLLVPDDDVYQIHSEVTSETGPTVSWSTSLPSSLNVLGAYTFDSRPTPTAGRVGRRIYLTDRRRWQICRRYDPSAFTDVYYAWANSSGPTGWLQQFDDEAEADAHATAVNDVAYFDGELQIVTSFVAGTVHRRYFWDPLGTGGTVIASVQPDWDQTDDTARDYIKNKPTIPSSFADLSGQVSDAQIPASIMRDAEFTAAAVRGLLGLTEAEVNDLLTGATISGRVITFTQNDGTTATITVPAGTGGMADGVVASGAFSSDATMLTLTLEDGTTIDIAVPSLLRSTLPQVQSDWDETDDTDDSFIQNKPTDAEIGDKAFSNPPPDLDDTEKGAARTAIGAGTASSFGDLSGAAADAQIPPGITRDTELAAAIGDFLTQTQIEALGYRTAAQVSAAIVAGEFFSDGGVWTAPVAHAQRKVVRHKGATYLALQNVPANTASTTEPGVGTQWETYWARIGWEDGPPNALVGAVRDGLTVTFTRESGDNPLAITLPETLAGNLTEIARLIPSARIAQDTFVDVGAYPRTGGPFIVAAWWGTAGDDNDRLFFVLSAETMAGLAVKAAGDASASSDAVATEINNSAELRLARTADGRLLAAVTEFPWIAGLSYLYIWQIEASEPRQIGNFRPRLLANRTLATSGNVAVTPYAVLAGTVGTAPLVCPPTGFLLIDVHGDVYEGNVTWREAVDLRASTAANPLHIRPTGGGFASGDIYTNDDNEVFFKIGSAFTTTDSLRITVWHVETEQPIDYGHGLSFYQHWTDTPLDGSPPFAVTPVRNNEGVSIAADAEYTQTLLADSLPAGLDLGAPIFIMYSGAIVVGNSGGGRTNWIIEIGYRLFPGTPNQMTFWRGHRESMTSTDEESFPLVGFQTHSRFPPGPYPTDAGGTFQMTQAVFDSPVPFNLVLRLRGFARQDPTFTSRVNVSFVYLAGHDLAFTVAQFGPSPTALRPPTLRPQISRFDVTGDQTPTAGSIAGKSYSYDLALSQSSHASIVRIVGFEGTDAAPSAVAVLESLDASEFAHHSGSVAVPAGISLAADEVYTIRAEAYETGQAVTEEPVSYRDYRITAQAAAAQTRFIRVPRQVGSPAARPTAATLGAALAETGAGVIATAGSAIGTWIVAGIPNTGEWLVGWIVPQGAAQPNHYTQAGIPIDSAVAARFAFTENSVDHYVYLFADANWVDDSYNNSTIVVT